MTRKIAFYARATRRTGDGSIEVQIERGKAFAAARGWSLVTACSDIDIPGVVFKARPGIRSLIAHLERENIDAVVCDRLTRISHRSGVLLRFLGELHLNGIELWITEPGLEIFPRNLFRHLPDEHEAREPGVDDRDHAAVPPGTGISTPPFGYRLSHAHDAEGQRISGFRTIDPAEAQTVRRIFELYADGFSPHEIAGILNADGIEGPRGKAWRDTATRGNTSRATGILHNRLYVGQLTSAGGSPSGYAPALRIVSDGLWERARERDDEIASSFDRKTNRKKRG